MNFFVKRKKKLYEKAIHDVKFNLGEGLPPHKEVEAKILIKLS